MNWGVVWEVARAVYSVGLLALGAVLLVGALPALRVLRDLTAALTSTASVLRAATSAEKDVLEQIRATVERVEHAHAADRDVVRAELAEVKALLVRLVQVREG